LVGAVSRLPAALSILMVGFALSAIGCGGGAGTDSTAASSSQSQSGEGAGRPVAVTISDYEYDPATITVPVGTVVKFTNKDSTPHTATSKQSGAFESGSIDTGKTGEVKLEEAGTFAYYCAFHPFMKGTIRVE
jgi:plastocyanin